MSYDQYHPQSTEVLWTGSPSDATSVATGGRVQTAGYRLTTDALYFASGVLSSREEQIPLWAIRDADMNQTMTQKARGVADISLVLDPQYRGSFGQHAVVLKSLRDARQIRDLILGQANTVRRYWAEYDQNKLIEANRAGASQVSVAGAQPASGGTDVMAKLVQLGEMKTAGLLTDDEFTAAKAKLLGL